MAAFQHHLWPPTHARHSPEESIGIGQLVLIHSPKGLMDTCPQLPVGLILNVREGDQADREHPQGSCGENGPLHHSPELPEKTPDAGTPVSSLKDLPQQGEEPQGHQREGHRLQPLRELVVGEGCLGFKDSLLPVDGQPEVTAGPEGQEAVNSQLCQQGGQSPGPAATGFLPPLAQPQPHVLIVQQGEAQDDRQQVEEIVARRASRARRREGGGEEEAAMGSEAPRLARQLFLRGLAAAFLAAFASLYVQLPGLYGRDGILPARKMLRFTGKDFWQQLRDSPTLLWLGPHLGLDTEQGLELLCLMGTLLSFGALVLEPLRDSLVFLALWGLYLSVYQVGQVFLYFQWDSLLLETGFLAVLVAPMHLLKWRSTTWRAHDGVTFWLVRWLLFRLMFASGVVKLTSRCPTWWGLTALTYHYETQCIPTPSAWFAHQMPVWFQKLSVVGTYVIEIAIPPLFFVPLRRLRHFAFYSQVVLQALIILTGNYNFFNLLTVVLSFSLLDDEHVGLWLGQGRKKASGGWAWRLPPLLAELAVYGLLTFWTSRYFGLTINWEKRILESKTDC
ncbi:PREDICTED: lipase maturation factor 2-like [Thamnophis sirtalis]|uniref:Lipase maturation factor n=1 Tax=Thamnophis sirtalis TaxID=35019 RepID=A0A6I9Y9P9_9SAUR|nr:PREDICTED: lipase maturation factor 2-like [Thamnophis sirtalis]